MACFALVQYLEAHTLPLLGYLALWLGSVILKIRRPKKGVGYEPLSKPLAPFGGQGSMTAPTLRVHVPK